MVGATQHHVSCTFTCSHLHTWSVLRHIMFLALAHMVGATQLMGLFAARAKELLSPMHVLEYNISCSHTGFWKNELVEMVQTSLYDDRFLMHLVPEYTILIQHQTPHCITMLSKTVWVFLYVLLHFFQATQFRFKILFIIHDSYSISR